MRRWSKQRGATVLFGCPPALRRLLQAVAGVDRLLVHGDALPPFAMQAALLSLPGLLQTRLDTIPGHVPYLGAEPDRVEHWRKELESLDGFKIGIVWQGNPRFTEDRQRSIPLRCFEALARVEGVRLVSLQKGPGAEHLQALAGRLPVVDVGDRLEDFVDTAAVLKNLDLIVCADTAVAHLAGALAAPVWLALPFVPDWRWLRTARTARGIRTIVSSASAAGAIGTRSSSASSPSCTPCSPAESEYEVSRAMRRNPRRWSAARSSRFPVGPVRLMFLRKAEKGWP